MPSLRQTRRTVGMRAEIYERLRLFCESEQIVITRFVEKAIIRELDKRGAPKVTRTQAIAWQRRAIYDKQRADEETPEP